MSSERPKLGPDILKVVTGWDTRSGRVVYLNAERNWTENLEQAEILSGTTAQEALALALKDQTRATDPYFMQVTPEGRVAGRETLRETIRARGPTTHLSFGKQAGNP